MSQTIRNVLSLHWGLIAMAALMLNACTTFSPDHGFSQVETTVKPYLKQSLQLPESASQEEVLTERVNAILQKPLDADSAVQVALFNNKGLRASFYELGMAEADLVQAGRLPNPRFSMLYARNNGDYKIEQAITLNIFSLLTMPKATEIERKRFAITQKEVALKVLQLANETRVAYFTAVAANQSLEYARQVKEAAGASNELAKRMTKAGNWSKLDQAREQGFYADALLDSKRALIAQKQAQEKLARLLGLSGSQLAFKLSSRLPEMPDTLDNGSDLEQTAMQQRLDLQIGRLNVEALAKELGLTKLTRFINVLELGPARVLEGSRNDAYKKGIDISFELPIFDWSESRVVRAESRYQQALNQVAQVALNAQSEVRLNYANYQANYEIAKQYRDEIVPIRKSISEEYQLRYNGMLVSVFDLLADSRMQIASVNHYIESLRDFWIAQSELQMSLIGGSAVLGKGN